jgi:16S rRNA (cytidine1402-2'-O)-methyltransferase
MQGGEALSGTLYVVGTPIGNLEDITFRAVRILKEADLIACEDTRQTRKLLDHYGISKPTISYHEHNEIDRSRELIAVLLQGSNVALVSDAGMPLISDPGYRLVSAAIENGVRVEAVPGPSALLTALAASGLPANSFYFGGFLPAKPGQRLKAIEALKETQATLVFFEAPHRILDTLAAIQQVLGDRLMVVARELTKMHEEYLRGTASEIGAALAARESVKGEITLLISRPSGAAHDETPLDQAVESCVAQGLSRMDAIKSVAHRRGLSKRDVYRQLEKAKR